MSSSELEHDRLVRGIAKGAGIVFLSTILARIFGYTIRVLIARRYGPEGYGLVSTSIAILTMTSLIALLGFPNALSRQISFYVNAGGNARVKNLIVAAYGLSSFVALIFALLLISFSRTIAVQFYDNALLAPFLRYFGAGLFFYVWIQLASSVFKAFKQMFYYVVLKDLARFSMILVTLLLALYLNSPTEQLGLFYFISYATVGVAGTIIIFFFTRIRRFPLVWSGRDVKELFTFSFPLVLASIAYSFLFRIDILMIGYFSNQSQVGIYDAAVRIAELLTLVISSFAPFLLPAMTEFFARNDRRKLADTFTISTKWIFMLTLPMFSLMVFAPGFFLNLLFGEQFVQAQRVLQIIVWGFMFSASVGATGSMLIVLGKTKINFYNNLVVLILNFVLNYLLIPKYGIVGGGIASAVSLILLNVVMLGEIYAFTKIQPFTGHFLRIAVVAFGLAALLRLTIGFATVQSGLLALVIYAGLYALGLKVSRSFDENDAVVLREFTKRLRLRQD